jgi:hypothetical protein
VVNGNGALAPELAPSDVAAAAAADAAAAAEHPIARITLSTGIVLTLIPVSPRAVRDAGDRLPRPEVPTFYNESKERDEPNPDHPEYRAALDRWQYEGVEASLKFALSLGTRPEFIPDDRVGPDDDRWIEDINEGHEVNGTEPPPLRRTGKGRYLDWLLWYAVGSDEDTFRLSRILLATTVPTEEEVARALDSFRRTAQRLRSLDLAVVEGR